MVILRESSKAEASGWSCTRSHLESESWHIFLMSSCFSLLIPLVWHGIRMGWKFSGGMIHFRFCKNSTGKDKSMGEGQTFQAYAKLLQQALFTSFKRSGKQVFFNSPLPHCCLSHRLKKTERIEVNCTQSHCGVLDAWRRIAFCSKVSRSNRSDFDDPQNPPHPQTYTYTTLWLTCNLEG